MIAAYFWPQSARPGEIVDIFCHTTSDRFRIEVNRQGVDSKTVAVHERIPGREQTVTGDIAAEGCRWDSTLELGIEPSWPSGFYLVRLEDNKGNKAEAFFVVRAESPGDAILVLSTSTWNAYNTWGGQSFYTGGMSLHRCAHCSQAS